VLSPAVIDLPVLGHEVINNAALCFDRLTTYHRRLEFGPARRVLTGLSQQSVAADAFCLGNISLRIELNVNDDLSARTSLHSRGAERGLDHSYGRCFAQNTEIDEFRQYKGRLDHGCGCFGLLRPPPLHNRFGNFVGGIELVCFLEIFECRFGVSQLHQLRGRVGRGAKPGLCLLVTDAPEGSPARQRLAAVASTLDGFRLSRLDLEQRREGDVLGAAQAGRKRSLKLLTLLSDETLIGQAREEATAASLRDVLAGEAVAGVADLLADAAEPADGAGRPLFSGMRARGRPDDPMLRLWWGLRYR